MAKASTREIGQALFALWVTYIRERLPRQHAQEWGPSLHGERIFDEYATLYWATQDYSVFTIFGMSPERTEILDARAQELERFAGEDPVEGARIVRMLNDGLQRYGNAFSQPQTPGEGDKWMLEIGRIFSMACGGKVGFMAANRGITTFWATHMATMKFLHKAWTDEE